MPRSRIVAAAALALVTSGAGLLTSSPAAAGLPDDLIANTTDALITFNSTAPAGTADEVPVLAPPTVNFLLGIDVRPATQVVYGVFDLVDGSLAVATIDHTTGAVGPLVTLTLNGSTFLPNEQVSSVDFNPVADRIRILFRNVDDSYGVDVDTGAMTENGDLNGILVQGPHFADGAAYTNSTPGPAPASTVLYDLLDLSSTQDDDVDSLATQNPSTGALTLVGPLGRELQGGMGFEITAGGAGFVAATERLEPVQELHARTKAGFPEPTSLYSIDLATGATTAIDTIGDGLTRVRGLTSFPVQVPAVTTTTLATSTTAAVSPTSAVSPTTRVLARTGEQETGQSLLGVGLIAAGGVALVAAARLRTRRA
jgi:hypothetical protein